MKFKHLILVAVPAMLWSCGSKTENTPEGVTKAFVKAMASKDFDGAKDLCTEESGKAIDALKGMAAMMPETELEKEEVKCETEGDKSKCTFCCAKGKGEEVYNLKKEGENWKVEFSKGGGSNDMMDNTEEMMEDTQEAIEEAVDAAEEATTEEGGEE